MKLKKAGTFGLIIFAGIIPYFFETTMISVLSAGSKLVLNFFFLLFAFNLSFNGLLAQEGNIAVEDKPKLDKPIVRKLSKKEAREWKKKAKYYKKNPEILKAREESQDAEQERYYREIAQMTAAYAELQKIMDTEKQEIQQLVIQSKLSNDSLKFQNDSLKFAVSYLADSIDLLHKKYYSGNDVGRLSYPDTLNKNIFNPGEGDVYYSVQIGAVSKRYHKQNLPEHLQNYIVDSSSQFYQYLLGRFASFKAATEFRNEVRMFGVRGAFVVAYQNGIRLSNRLAQKTQRRRQKIAAEETKAKSRTIDSSQLQSRIHDLENEKNRLQNQLDSSNTNSHVAVSEIQRLHKQIETLKEQLESHSKYTTNEDNQSLLSNGPVITHKPDTLEENILLGAYQVQIYSGTSKGAEEYKQKFLTLYKDQDLIISIKFENPHYKLRIGSFETYDKALELKNKLSQNFRDAFITRLK